MKPLSRILALPLLAVLLSGCAKVQEFNDKRFAPEYAKAPAQFLTVTGTIGEGFESVGFVVEYQTYAKKCHRLNPFPRLTHSPRTVELAYPAKIENGTYKARIDLDLFVPGQCQWMISRIFHRIVRKGLKPPDPYTGILVWFRETDNRLPEYDIECIKGVSRVPGDPDKTPFIVCEEPLGDYDLARRTDRVAANIVERKKFSDPRPQMSEQPCP